MNISEGQEIAGVSALKIRELFRKCGGIYLGIKEAMYYLGIGPRNAKKLLIQLEKDGYLEHQANPRPYGDSWELTPKGAGLRMASAAPPIKIRLRI